MVRQTRDLLLSKKKFNPRARVPRRPSVIIIRRSLPVPRRAAGRNRLVFTDDYRLDHYLSSFSDGFTD